MFEPAKFMTKIKPKIREWEPRKYVKCWSENERYNNAQSRAFVVVLATKGCSWAKTISCFMCGYPYDGSSENATQDDILFQFQSAMKNYKNEPVIKIYTSGSFLDEQELSRECARKILEIADKSAKKIVVESRPEYITPESLNVTEGLTAEFEVAIGLESADDEILKFCVNKGFTFETFKKSAQISNEHNIKVRVYLMLKLPFLTELCAMQDVINSIKKVANYAETISINPLTIQKQTLVERLYNNNELRPPFFWSLVECLKAGKAHFKGNLVSYPVGAGSRFGIHNCGKCDAEIANAITNFSLTQELKYLENLNCDCRNHWKTFLKVEDESFGIIRNLQVLPDY